MAAIDKNAAKNLQKSYFDVLGLCCSSEVPLIEKILKSLDGVKDVTVIVPTKTVIVIHDSLLISQLQIVKALNQARLEANIRAIGDKSYQKKWPSPYAVACGVLLMLSFLKYFYPPLKWLAIGAVAVGIIPIILRGVAAVRNFTLDINILVLIAVAGSIALKDYWEAGTIVFLFTIAEWLESRASHKATAVMSSLVNVVPQRAVLAETGEEVNADEVKLNTILAVKAGETIPIDGIVVEGNCEVDEKSLTGESFPVGKEKDSTVWAGTINLNGYVSIKTTAVAEDCVVARMAKLVEDAQNNKSRTQRFIDKCAKYYTPVVVAMSASFVIIPAALRVHNEKEWYRLALVILVSACPCALILSTPVAMFCALSKAATSGLLFKGAEYLETLAKVKIIAFDKTGTITRGEFEVIDFRSLLDDVSLKDMLYWVSSIESKSSHPMASALIDYAQSHSVIPKPDRVEQFQNFPGEGIYGKIEGKEIYVGNRKISLRAGCTTVPTLEDDAREGKSIGYVFLGSSPAGIFSLSDVCRTGVKDALQELKMMGIKTAMLTGDSYGAAKHAQNQLGGALDIIHAELLPEDKARIIQEFQKEAPTAMIGDGLNDAPALAAADIGISMGISGSALATETGNVILMSNDIKRIPKATRLARRVRRKIVENVILSISTKTAIVALAIAGHPLVWAAVLADVGTCLLVIFNSMLLLRGTHKHGRKCCKSSAASHVHKSKCKTTSCQSSRTHQACCPDIHTHDKHELKTCSSDMCQEKCQLGPLTSNSCGNNTCSGSIAKHGCHSHNNALNEAKDMDHGSCNIVDQDTGSCGGYDHGCLDHLAPREENKSANSVQRHSGCAADDEIHDTEHCDHISHSLTPHDNSASSLEVGQLNTSNNNCQVNCCTNHSSNQLRDEEIGNLVEKCCKPSNQEDLSRCKKHDIECGVPIRSTINVLRGNSHVNCTIKSCSTLEKRQVGECCRKECCAKSAHLGASFRGGLSEIIIE